LTAIPNLASFDDDFNIYGDYKYGMHGEYTRSWNVSVTWRDIFGFVAPYLLQHPNDRYIEILLQNNLFKIFRNNNEKSDYRHFESAKKWDIDDQVYQTIKIQLVALDLVKLAYLKTVKGGMALFWSLTPKGQAVMMEVQSVKSDS
jgi:hypothetical protein